ncbi:hypothetical protein L420_03761 [Enterobacter hormaechei subsp. hoffmannii UCICRE 9]|uniref:hypothetical protein n=1 Tax=Enterobacter hormaechei TaxID=158836 RepID=UPI0003BF2598|nr:hypothetical protein [Enterobacter hormaechei]ESL86566.1 hypothetical protein L420_03761 [Enterobacter hormaechei subsp. hoffmannii UCICRE 9]
MTNISAVIAELMEKVEVNSPRIALLHCCLSEAAKRIAELEQNLAESEARCAALAAENAGLKDEISNITFMRDDDFFGSTQRAQEVMGRLVNVKTPATDAFVAGVKADGIEDWVFSRCCSGNDTTDEAIKFADALRNWNGVEA